MSFRDHVWEAVVATAAWPIAVVALVLIAILAVRELLRRRR